MVLEQSRSRLYFITLSDAVTDTILSTLLFDRLEVGAEEELSAAAVSCTLSGLLTGLWFLVMLPAGLLLSFCILNDTKCKEKILE